MTEDGHPLWWFYSFFPTNDPSENVSVYHSWACGAPGVRNQGRRNNESSHCLQGSQTLLPSGGSSSLNPHFGLPQRQLQRHYPNNRDTPSSDHCLTSQRREMVVITSQQPIGHSAAEHCCKRRNFKEKLHWAFGQIALALSIITWQHIVRLTDAPNKRGQLFPQRLYWALKVQ